MTETALVAASSAPDNTQTIIKAGIETGLDTVKELGKVILSNPVFAVILANMLIEYSQGIMVWKGKEEWHVHGGSTSWDSPGGTPRYEYGRVDEPLISQGLATTLESLINSGFALQAISDLGGVAGIIKLLGLK